MSTLDSINQRTLDSIGYQNKHASIKSLTAEIDTLQYKIIRLGYIDSYHTEIMKETDSLYTSEFYLGERVRSIQIQLDSTISDKIRLQFLQDPKLNYLEIPIDQLETVLTNLNTAFIEDGYPFSKLKLDNIQKVSPSLMSADLKIISNQARRIDKIVVKGYEKFPKSYVRRYLKIKEGDIFKLAELKERTDQLSNLIFANQVREPEVLFTKDSTVLYLYIEKDPSNNFDGFLGFGTNEQTNKLELDGYLNLHLINNLNYGESLKISYKSDEIDQQTIDVQVSTPYLFRSPIGAEFRLNIFRKDTTFVTTNQHLKVNYQVNPKSRLSLGISGITSSNLQDDTSTFIEDYKSTFYSLTYDFVIPQYYDDLFPVNFLVDLSLNQGNRKTDVETTNQSKILLNTYKLFNLNTRNSIYLRFNGAALISNNYFDNELFRFGGINSIRGFEENSLVANLYGVINTEYRYRLSNNLFVNSVIDGAYYQNQLIDVEEKLFGFGFGFGLLTNTGLFRFNYAVSKVDNQPFRLSNSKVHISLVARF
ncbi:POTRA domain-containing protein [Winogradskyella aurantiaca]|uniref:POTRA domain-containing protein n=1 Tax=Winogradskyella aurantiaca TaxID=2219558 RepID=UPI001E42AFCD|nr:POTRA domain-containing protein [Winogradskyella aurantiaca]